MTRVHLQESGTWAECLVSVEPDCALPFHVDELTVEEVGAIPLVTLLPLFEAVDPPNAHIAGYTKDWADASRQLHRDFDLPARVKLTGTLEWYQHGVQHRGRDLPAVVMPDGAKQWWWHGTQWRPSGGPTRVYGDGVQTWYIGGEYDYTLHREDGPAVVHPDGREEFWVKGKQVE